MHFRLATLVRFCYTSSVVFSNVYLLLCGVSQVGWLEPQTPRTSLQHCLMLVTTIIVTYNHERYIADAISSALSQKGDFEHEILISDDGSADSTHEIVREYARRYPSIIRDISSRENLGISANYKKCIAEAKGDFIAVLEGDDRWSVPDKLKKQLEFLVANPDCHMVFSAIAINDGVHPLKHLGRYRGLSSKLTGADFFAADHICLIGNFSCCMFRADSLKNMPESLYERRLSEIAVSFYLESMGPIGFIPDEQVVYNEHADGTWSGSDRLSRLRQQRFCREAAMKVCSRRWVPKFNELISAINVQLDQLQDQSNAENAQLRGALHSRDEEIVALKKSAAYRAGMVLTSPFRVCWRLLKRAFGDVGRRSCVAAS